MSVCVCVCLCVCVSVCLCLGMVVTYCFPRQALRRSPLRTLDLSAASLVVLPIDTAISSKLQRPCNGTTHRERLGMLTTSVHRWLMDHAGETGASGGGGTAAHWRAPLEDYHPAKKFPATRRPAVEANDGDAEAAVEAEDRRELKRRSKAALREAALHLPRRSLLGKKKAKGSGGSSGSGGAAAYVEYRGPPVLVFGTYWATYRDWGGRSMRRNEMEPEAESRNASREASSGGGGMEGASNGDAAVGASAVADGRRRLAAVPKGPRTSQLHSQRGGRSLLSWPLAPWPSGRSSLSSSSSSLASSPPPTLWSLLAPHGILVTIDEYFSHDWPKVIVAPYLAHADVTRRLLTHIGAAAVGPAAASTAASTAERGGRGGGAGSEGDDGDEGGFRAVRSAGGGEYRDGRSLQLFFRGGVDHGSMCKRRRPHSRPVVGSTTGGGEKAAKRSASEVAAAANRRGDGTTTWLREAAVSVSSAGAFILHRPLFLH